MTGFRKHARGVPARALAAMLLGLVAAGCGRSYPTTVPVSGRITYEGKPLEAGEIAFQPLHAADGIPSRPAIGFLSPDGTYELSTFKQGDGLMPGDYAVVVTSYEGEPPVEELNASPRPPPSRIPMKYASPTTSGLRATIPANAHGRQTFDFDLKE